VRFASGSIAAASSRTAFINSINSGWKTAIAVSSLVHAPLYSDAWSAAFGTCWIICPQTAHVKKPIRHIPGPQCHGKEHGAPFQTAAALRADAEKEVDKIVARVEATSQAGGLRQLNRSYKAYRAQQIAKAERAQPYSKFLEERYTAKIVRSVAAVWCERL
jgi:hypothetical protein